jgi:SAM-dependent methyltransferase
VVQDRFNTREKNLSAEDNPYSLMNPAGYYGTVKLKSVFYDFFRLIRKNGRNITGMKMLDLGCGTGGWTRYLAEIKGSPEGITGIDLSSRRIEEARRMNPAIDYQMQDITRLDAGSGYDLVTAIDVFSHLNTRTEIDQTLKDIIHRLAPDGYFIWIDHWARDHFQAPEQAGEWGFSRQQMKELAEKAGFKIIAGRSLFRRIFGRTSTLYYSVKGYPFWLLDLLAAILPGPPGNLAMIFRKCREDCQ